MKKSFIVFLALPSLAYLTGCTSYYDQRRDVEMRRQTAINSMRADLQRLQARVEGFALAQEDLYNRIDALQASTTRTTEEQNAALSELSRTLSATAAARVQMKQEIIDGLTSKMSEVIRTQQPAGRHRTQQGYEHVVEKGQTLSEIATVYKVTVQAIVDANGLRDANQVRAGQTLFIPE